jgi:hypothetical protein
MLQMKDLPASRQPRGHRFGGFSRRSPRLCLSLLASPLAALLVALLLPFSAPYGALRAFPGSAGNPPPSFKPRTMEAFSAYVRATDARNNTELQNSKDFLWVDALPEAARNRAHKSLAAGEPQIEQRSTLADGRAIPCADGMIHHWEGLIFIPGARLDDVLHVLEDYDRHSVYYAPDVARSRLEARDGDHFHAFLRFRRQKVITVVLNTNHDIRYFRDSPQRAHSRSSATHIAEVDNAGKTNEREKSRDDDNGFLWGMETWWRLQEKDGGVYVQSEVVSLTRNIPTGVGWMIGPFITSIPKDTLSFTLEATRKAVLAQMQQNQMAAR